MKNIIIKKSLSKPQYLTNGFNSRAEGKEKRISTLQDRTIEIPSFEQHRENRLGKKNRASGTCGI